MIECKQTAKAALRRGEGSFVMALCQALAHLCQAYAHADASNLPAVCMAARYTFAALKDMNRKNVAIDLVLLELGSREHCGRGTEMLEMIGAL